MKFKVEGKGVLQGISDIIKGLSGLLDKVFKSFEDSGGEIVKREKIPESQGGGEKVTFKHDSLFDIPVTMKIVPVSEDTSDLFFDAKGLKRIEYTERKDVKNEDINKEFTEWIKVHVKHIPTNASKNLRVTLQRVSAGKDTEIRLTAITGTTNVKAALDALDAVLEDETFFDMITEEPQSFEIIDCPEEDSFDVEPCESFDGSNDLTAILTAAITLSMNIHMLHWNSKGANFVTVHRLLEDWYHIIKWDIDLLGELCVELSGSAPNPGTLIEPTLLLTSNMEYSEREAYQVAYDHIDLYCMALETYYVNFSHDIQSTLDNMIRYWRKEQKYKITRSLK